MLVLERALMTQELLAFDRASARSFDKFGRMHVAQCRISKANVCPYYGREIPNFKALGLDSGKIYMLYRDPAELAKGAPSFRNSQLLMRHTPVVAHDPKMAQTVGTVGNVAFDGTYLVADQLTIWTREGIDLVETESARELSCGYTYVADMTPGQTPEGVAYDGVMRDIMGNHVTLVREGRAGPDILVSDEKPSEFPKMFKRPKLLAQLIAAGLVVTPADDAARFALDAALAGCTAADGEVEEMEDDPENPGVKRKRAKMATDTQIEQAIAAKGYVTATQAQQMATDAATKATANAVASIEALHAAREAVKPLVGIVALDSAEAVYRFALDQSKIPLEGVHPSAFPALVTQVIAAKKNPVQAPPSSQMAQDAAAAAAAALPGLGRVRVG